MELHEVRHVLVTGPFQLHLTFDDGIEGTVDLSHLRGQGVFRVWESPGAFEQVAIGDAGELCWGNEIDLCPQALYLGVQADSTTPALLPQAE